MSSARKILIAMMAVGNACVENAKAMSPYPEPEKNTDTCGKNVTTTVDGVTTTTFPACDSSNVFFYGMGAAAAGLMLGVGLAYYKNWACFRYSNPREEVASVKENDLRQSLSVAVG